MENIVASKDIYTNHNLRAYYSSTILEFLCQPSSEILGIIHSNDTASKTLSTGNPVLRVFCVLTDMMRQNMCGGELATKRDLIRT